MNSLTRSTKSFNRPIKTDNTQTSNNLAVVIMDGKKWKKDQRNEVQDHVMLKIRERRKKANEIKEAVTLDLFHGATKSNWKLDSDHFANYSRALGSVDSSGKTGMVRLKEKITKKVYSSLDYSKQKRRKSSIEEVMQISNKLESVAASVFGDDEMKSFIHICKECSEDAFVEDDQSLAIPQLEHMNKR